MGKNYQKPELVEMSGVESFGLCNSNGSGDDADCSGNGNDAFSGCAADGNIAGTNCIFDGNSPDLR